eukprot:356878-Chlamydomonas_euryale.AAC.3
MDVSAPAVHPHVVKLLEDLHTDTEAIVREDGEGGCSFTVQTGVRQGCIIATMLFNVFIDHILQEALSQLPPASNVGRCGCLEIWAFYYSSEDRGQRDRLKQRKDLGRRRVILGNEITRIQLHGSYTPYRCQTKSVSSHMNDRLEVAHNCFSRQLSSPQIHHSTADLHKLHHALSDGDWFNSIA